jgi:site-specific DNA recombinase
MESRRAWCVEVLNESGDVRAFYFECCSQDRANHAALDRAISESADESWRTVLVRDDRMPPMMRAVGYLRVSTAGQAERGMSLAAQRDRVESYAKSKRLALLDVVSEAASAAVRADEVFSWEHRPVLLDLMQRARDNEFDVLIVAKLDRLSRDHTTLVVLERELQRHAVTVHSVAEERNGDGPLAEFIRGQLALVAELERSMILERVGAGKAKKKQIGRHVHGRVPYGYLSERGVFTIDEARAEVVRRIFSDVRAGDSPGRVARALNAERIPSPLGAQWSPKAIERIVENVAYAGERYGVKRAHPAIVSRRVLNEARSQLDRRAQHWAATRAESRAKRSNML